MLYTLRNILRDNWEWRGQIWHLAVTEMQKEVRGTALGWVWLLLTPAVYVGVLWVAFAIGLRSGDPVNGVPFVVYLTAGIIPYQYCGSMFTGGANVYGRYSYLVNRLRFPIPVISTFFTLAHTLTFLITLVLVVLIMIIYRVPVSIHLIQFPFLIVIMFVFWNFWSMATSPLSAMSKDFHRLIRALSSPMFWISGVFFDINSIQIGWLKTVFHLNPIAFFISASRASLVEDYWVWERPEMLLPFVATFIVMILLAVFMQHRVGPEVADVI